MSCRAADQVLEVANWIRRGEIFREDAALQLEQIASQLEPDDLPGEVLVAEPAPGDVGFPALTYAKALGYLEGSVRKIAGGLRSVSKELGDGDAGDLARAQTAERIGRIADSLEAAADESERMIGAVLMSLRGAVAPSPPSGSSHDEETSP